MHAKAKRRHEAVLRNAIGYPAELDMLLDRYADSLLRATEWDADQWGFDPDRWMEVERVELSDRGGHDWPREVI